VPVWARRFPNAAGPDRGYDLKEAPSPIGYSVTGKLFHAASVCDDPFFLKTDAIGKVTPVCQDSLMLQQRPTQWTGDCSRQILQLTDIEIQPQVINPTTTERSVCGTLTGINSNNEVPDQFLLKQNYPNPFNPSTKIEFSIPASGNVSLKVYDVDGKLVSVILDNFRNKGSYSIDFNASNLSTGIYFYELKSEGFTETKKMMLVK